jgi:hypothetical protein
MENIDEITAAEYAADEAEAAGRGNGLDKEKEAEPAASAQADHSMPQLPDGIGLDYEEIRMMLSKKHETMLGNDEPIMMMVTLSNVLLGELEKVHKKHNEAVTKIMAEQSAKYIAGVKNTTDALSKTLAENSVDAIRNIFNAHGKALNANKINSRWCAAIIGISALANVVTMALTVWR